MAIKTVKIHFDVKRKKYIKKK